ncbi:hypothetical protein BHE74_00052302 [Ensete ventricosum]|nr:hypothetical protein BHE74_00052302 [Ensete ventricosum]
MQNLKPLETAWKRRCDPFSPNLALADSGDPRRSKGAVTVHSYSSDFLRAYLGRTIEPRGTKDKGRSLTSHAEAYYPLYCHLSPCTKKVDKRRASRTIGQGVVLALRRTVEPQHHYKKGQLLVIELAEDEDNETSEEALEPKEEAMEEDSQPADYAVHALVGYSNPQMMKVGGLPKQQPITILVDTGSINNFLNSKVAAARLALQIEGCNMFDVKVVDS